MTNESNVSANGLSTIEKVAAGTSAVIILTGLVYWVIQIQGVMEMLEMAYG